MNRNEINEAFDEICRLNDIDDEGVIEDLVIELDNVNPTKDYDFAGLMEDAGITISQKSDVIDLLKDHDIL